MAATWAAGLGLRSVGQLARLSGSQQGLQVNRGEARIVCKKEGIHPEFFDEAPVYCNGEHVMTTSGTKKEYVVDVWSGNHPFYQGTGGTLLSEKGRLEKWAAKYGTTGSMSVVPTLTKGEIVLPKKKKGNLKKGGRK